MNAQLNRQLVSAVATLIAQDAATHKDFMWAVGLELVKRAYALHMQQLGVAGTVLTVIKLS